MDFGTNASNEQFVTTTTEDFFDLVHKQIPTWIVVMAVTMVLAFIGNIFLAFVIVKSPRRQLSPVQVLILHTCIADIMFAMCTILPQLASFLTFPNFYGGEFLCRVVKYLQLVPMYASPYLLLAISVDRYVAVCKPLRAYRMKHNLVHYLASLAWFVSFAFATPNLMIFSLGYYDNSSTSITACVENSLPWHQKLSVLFFALFAWIIPSIAASAFYTLVCVEVWKSEKRQISSSISRGSLRKYTNSVTFHKVKTVKLTMTIVVCNFVLLAPFCMINLLLTFFPEITDDFITVTSVMLVGNANSCVNPWIYLIFNYKQIYQSFTLSTRSETYRYQTVMLTIRPAVVASQSITQIQQKIKS